VVANGLALGKEISLSERIQRRGQNIPVTVPPQILLWCDCCHSLAHTAFGFHLGIVF